MSMRVTYLSVDGEILSETRHGVEHGYLSDPLGSTAALLDSTGAKTDEFTYWPYGETRTRTGTNPTPFTWVGTLGYYSDASGAYARARTVSKELGRWVQVDPLWPEESAYGYAGGNPISNSDPLGKSCRSGPSAGEYLWYCLKPCLKKCKTAKDVRKCASNCVHDCVVFMTICLRDPDDCSCYPGQICDPCKDLHDVDTCQKCCAYRDQACMLNSPPSMWARCDSSYKACMVLCGISGKPCK